jgi:hypothetical protein
LAGDTVDGALTFSVDPSAALAGPCEEGATGVAGFAELHAYTVAASAHTLNIAYVLRFIQGSRHYGCEKWGDRIVQELL